jgi:hypothetical protein
MRFVSVSQTLSSPSGQKENREYFGRDVRILSIEGISKKEEGTYSAEICVASEGRGV